VEAYLDLISIQLDNQDAKSALDLIGKVVVMAPDSPRVYLYRARALLLSGELEQALRDANQALALDATLLEAYRVDGQALQANGDLVSSIKPLSTYVQYATKDDEALVWLGKAYAANQQTDLALQSFSDAISVNNQQVDAYLARADIYQANQQPDLALQDYNSLLKFKQNTFDANMGRSLAMFNLGQYGDAYIQMNHSQALAENDDELARLFYWRSKTLEKLGKLSAAQKDWKALLQLPTAVVPADWAAYANQKLVTILTPYPVATLPGSSAATATTTGTKTP
jgi:tetratricopeptide (TPR) repeat protein